MACREYTSPGDENSSEPKGWIRENTKIGPVLEITTCCLQGKYGVEIRIKSVHKDHSHSWVRISHGLNKLVTDLPAHPLKLYLLEKEFGPILNHKIIRPPIIQCRRHSGRNLVDPSLQDNVLIPDDFFEYTYHVGCAIG